MNTVKHIFGVLLVGVAIYLLTPLQEVPVLLLWGAFFIVCGVYLGATQALPKEASGWQYLWKGLGTLLLAWGLLALAGGFLGGRDVFKPLPRNVPIGTSTQADTSSAVLRSAAPLFERIASMEKLELRLEDARRSGKPVILDYYATWCTDCERMEQSTFRDPAVRSAIRTRFVALQADVTELGFDSSAMKKRFGVYGPPALVFLRADGTREADKPFYGYHSPSELLEMLSRF